MLDSAEGTGKENSLAAESPLTIPIFRGSVSVSSETQPTRKLSSEFTPAGTSNVGIVSITGAANAGVVDVTEQPNIGDDAVAGALDVVVDGVSNAGESNIDGVAADATVEDEVDEAGRLNPVAAGTALALPNNAGVAVTGPG